MALRDMASGASPLAQMIGNLDERPCKRITFPGRAEQVGLWALTQTESEAAKRRGFDYVRAKLKFSEQDLAWDEDRAKNDCVIIEILAAALRDPDEPINALVADSQEIRDRLKPDQIQLLYKEYLIYLDEEVPQVKDVEADLDELVSLVQRNFPIAASLTWRDTNSLRRSLHSAVARLASAATDSSGDSSSPNASADSSTS